MSVRDATRTIDVDVDAEGRKLGFAQPKPPQRIGTTKVSSSWAIAAAIATIGIARRQGNSSLFLSLFLSFFSPS